MLNFGRFSRIVGNTHLRWRLKWERSSWSRRRPSRRNSFPRFLPVMDPRSSWLTCSCIGRRSVVHEKSSKLSPFSFFVVVKEGFCNCRSLGCLQSPNQAFYCRNLGHCSISNRCLGLDGNFSSVGMTLVGSLNSTGFNSSFYHLGLPLSYLSHCMSHFLCDKKTYTSIKELL